MNHKKLILSVAIVLEFGLMGLRAQEVISAAGDNAAGSGGTVSYSIGQVVYTTNRGPNGSVVQGVQQPYEISVITEIEKTTGIELLISVYPNPSIDYLTLHINPSPETDFRLLSYRLFGLNGKLLETKKINGNQTIIDLKNQAAGSYFLSVTEENTIVKTFKIIKAQ